MSIFLNFLEIIPHFPANICLALVVLILLCGNCLYFFGKKRFNFYFILHSSYLSIGIFAVAAVILSTLLSNPVQVSFLLLLFLLLSGATGWIIALLGKVVKLGNVEELKKLNWGLAALSLIIAVLFFKFIFQNGLHDEYFHHAYLNSLLLNNMFPFPDPYNLSNTVGTRYHVGLYFPAMALKQLFNLPVEESLDLLKIILILPLLPLSILALRKLFSFGNKTSMLAGVSMLLTGPFFLFFDTFSLNVVWGGNYPQIYTPILFELAGITWFGLIFYFVYILLLLGLIKENRGNSLKIFLLIPLMFISLQFINQAFALVFFSNLLVLGVFYLGRLKKLKKTHLAGLVVITVVSLLTILNFGILNNFKAGYPSYDLLKVFYGFIKSPDQWGFPFVTSIGTDGIHTRTGYASLGNFMTIQMIGLLNIVAVVLLLGTLIKRNIADKKIHFLLLFNCLFFPLLVYFVDMGSYNLALNKFLRISFIWLPVALIYLALNFFKSGIILFITNLLLVCSILPSIIFFIRTDYRGAQQFWEPVKKEDKELVELLSGREDILKIVTNNRATSYLLANTVNAQVQACDKECPAGKLAEFAVINKSHPPLFFLTEDLAIYENSEYKVFALENGAK